MGLRVKNWFLVIGGFILLNIHLVYEKPTFLQNLFVNVTANLLLTIIGVVLIIYGIEKKK